MFIPASELPVLLAQYIFITSRRPIKRKCSKCLSQGHNNVTIVWEREFVFTFLHEGTKYSNNKRKIKEHTRCKNQDMLKSLLVIESRYYPLQDKQILMKTNKYITLFKMNE